MSPPRYATVSELRGALESRGLHPKHRLGQNFLIDLNLLGCVADAAELAPNDVALEIGCGTGALTGLLAERAGKVVAAEIDQALIPLASESLEPHGNVSFVAGDAMGTGVDLSPELRRAVVAALDDTPDATLKLAANLPYGIATAAIKALIVGGPRPALMAVTVQSEVADRMAARPGTREYGLLSVLLQSHGEVQRLRTLKPSVFWPRPKVDSALVRIRLNKTCDVPPAQLLRVAGKLLEQRRKRLAKAMQIAGLAGSGAEAEAMLREPELDPDCRPDSLSVDDYVRLTQALEARSL